MRKSGVKTGRLVRGAKYKGAMRKTAEGGPQILFEPGADDANSTLLCLDAEQKADICVFGLCPGDRIEVWKVKTLPTEMPSSCPGAVCIPQGMPKFEGPELEFCKPVYCNGEVLALSPECSDLTIEGPGEYQLRMCDPDMSCRVYAEASMSGVCCK